MLAVAIGIFDEVEAFTTPLPNTHLDNSPAKSLPVTLLGHPRKQEIVPFLSSAGCEAREEKLCFGLDHSDMLGATLDAMYILHIQNTHNNIYACREINACAYINMYLCVCATVHMHTININMQTSVIMHTDVFYSSM